MSQQRSPVNEFHPESEYHAGRLLAVCQHIQDLAGGDVGRTYVDSYFAAACTNPSFILPVVWRTARRRLRQIEDWKVRREVEGLATRLVCHFEGTWPKGGRLKKAADFQLGFFHQRAELPFRDTRRRIATAGGTTVKSYGEKLIADILWTHGITALYEEKLTVPDLSKETGLTQLEPDFTVRSRDGLQTLYIEYCGLLGNKKYDKEWDDKRSRYKKLGAKLLQDVRVNRQASDDAPIPAHTLMQILPMDVRNSETLKNQILEAVALITGHDVNLFNGEGSN